jgi:glycosyltransferase involved in cell wall biosynthesis
MPTPTILHFSTGKYFRGGERQVEFLHKGLCSAGMRSVLVCRRGGELSGRKLADTTALSWRGEWDVIGLAAFIRICKQHRPAIIHSHDGHSLAHASIAGALTGAAVIHTRRVIFPLGTLAFSRWKYDRCKALIGVSEAVARACKEALPQVRVHVVHDGVDWTAPGLPRRDARRELGIDEKAFVIGAVAYFTEEKDLPLLASLARALQSRSPSARIACIGPVHGRAWGLPENLIFPGFRDNAAQYYAAFDAFVSASPREGLGSALLDAVVRDIPCVAVDGGGTRDLFLDRSALIKPGDAESFAVAVTRLIDGYRDARATATACGVRARGMFSIQTMVQRTIDVYKTVTVL